MKTTHIDKFTLGWLVGNFEPALLHSKDIEVGVKHLTKGQYIEKHYQKISTEYNYIAHGKLIANGVELNPGDIFIYDPEEITVVDILEDSTVVVIKSPSLGYDDKVVIDD